MRIRYTGLITLAAAGFLLGCRSSAPVFGDAERSAVEAEIRAARDAYFDAATGLDAETMVAFWDDDFLHVSNAYAQPLTLEGLREAWRPLSHIEMEITSERVAALSRNAGYTVLMGSYVLYDDGGNAVDRSDWTGTHVWVRTDEGWRVQYVHEGRPPH